MEIEAAALLADLDAAFWQDGELALAAPQRWAPVLERIAQQLEAWAPERELHGLTAAAGLACRLRQVAEAARGAPLAPPAPFEPAPVVFEALPDGAVRVCVQGRRRVCCTVSSAHLAEEKRFQLLANLAATGDL